MGTEKAAAVMSTQLTSPLRTRDLVAIGDLSAPEIVQILDLAAQLRGKTNSDFSDRQVALVFYENSTRTYNSFVTAVHHLGATICGFTSASGTSVLKGETLHDTIRMFEAYADAIVLRHPKDGSARWAADISKVPIINAGDGKNQHPTQTLLDLYAIRQTQGRLTGLSVALAGDLKYGRTVHSLAEALSMFEGNTLYLAAPPSLEMPEYLINFVTERGVKVEQFSRLEDVADDVDILYMTRIQRERMPDEMEYERVRGAFRLTTSMLDQAKPNLKVLHPLPRVDEIDKDLDSTDFAYYFEQAAGGVDVRKALLTLLLGGQNGG
jgi:aspartate carbamoyltransferase catalytic subunit